jgi:hypothetical protein
MSRAVCRGQGKKPGNVVRLCRLCNSFKMDRDLDKLSPQFAQRVRTAAAQFKEYWKSGCKTPVPPIQTTGAVVRPEELPDLPDPSFIALLRAVERGDDPAIPALASWLEERGDPRDGVIRAVAGLKAVVTEMRSQADEASWFVEFRLNGKRCGSMVVGSRSPADTEESFAERIRELLKLTQSHEVWRRLGLSESQQSAAKQYLGINSMGVAATVEKIAEREGKKVRTIRHRIDLALHFLTIPSPRGARKKR